MKRRYLAALIVAVAMGCAVWYGCSKDKDEELQVGTIYGTVTDFATGNPIGNANVKLKPGGETTLTGSDGSYEFSELKAGKYSLALSKAEYNDLDDDYVIALEAGKKVRRDVQMKKQVASLQITDMQGNAIDTLDFGEDESVTARTFNVYNNGTVRITCQTSYQCDWITSVSNIAEPLQPGDAAAVTVIIDRTLLADGVNSTLLYITSENGSNELRVVATFRRGTMVMTTGEATEVTASSAKLSGRIANDGGRPVIARGICYGTTQEPTIEGDHTTDGNDTGAFSHTVTGLSASTTYYARAYATNRLTTVYASNIVSFTTTSGLPTVSTTTPQNVTATTAVGGGNVTNNGGFNVTARGICWNTMGNPDLNDPHTTNGSGNGTFTGNMSGLTPGTTYHVRAYATNSHGTEYGNDITFTTQSGAAVLTTTAVSDITATTAKSGGNITDNGGFNVTARGICWNTMGNPDLNDPHTTNGSGNGTFTGNMSGLTPGTTYHVRAYATNSHGTEYGNDITFTTQSGAAVLTTTAVSDITATTAKSGGNITDNGGFNVTARGICWNTTGSPDISDHHTSNGTGSGAFTANLTGLTHGTTYHVRAYATTAQGTYYGNELAFATSSGVVTLTLSEATNITASSATCSASITADGGSSVTERGFCWSTSQYPTIASSHVAVGSGSGNFTTSLTGLNPGATYYVRAYATNVAGTSYSSQISFTTTNGLPAVSTGTVASITATTATCSGNVTADGGFPVTAKGFCWSTAQYPTLSDGHSNDGSGVGSYNGSLTSLSINTTYYVRAYATNSVGTVYGNQVSFTTANGLPIVSTTTPSLNGTTAVSGGNVSSDGGFPVTARGICYGSLPNPDLTSNYQHTSDGSGTGYYSSTFSLPHGSGAYYIRAYATNVNGTTYGEQKTVIQPYDTLPTFQYGGHIYKVAPAVDEIFSFEAAISYCNNLTLYGYSDWKMPTIDELRQMYIERYSIGGFSLAYYWSNSNGSRSYINFSNGSEGTENPASRRKIRAIRIDN